MKYLFSLLLFISLQSFNEDEIYFTNSGYVSFKSEAQQELIKASSNGMRGLLDPVQRTYVFKVLIRTFHGFNSSLQQEHFNEKYLESEKYPEATFSGKIIEDIDLTIDGVYDIRAKGRLNIHGVEMERIIRSTVTVTKGVMLIETHFSILLSDHNIKVPKVVHEKIASEIHVDMKAELIKKK
jgi:hypothetical protein